MAKHKKAEMNRQKLISAFALIPYSTGVSKEVEHRGIEPLTSRLRIASGQ